jgi:TPP-dependent indolepyruvate ferredoxin oxidoreductase alpha subunit
MLADAGVRLLTRWAEFPARDHAHARLRRTGCEEILVIEEKAPSSRAAARAVLQRARCGRAIVGKKDADGRPLVRAPWASCGPRG